MPLFLDARCPGCGEKVEFPVVQAPTVLVNDGYWSYLTVRVGDIPNVEHNCQPADAREAS